MPKFQTKEKKLNYYLDLVNRAEKDLEEQAPLWKERADNYDGLYFETEDDLHEQYSANIVQGLASLIVPSIYFRDPKVLCSSKRRGGERQARLTEALLNYWIKESGENGIKQEMKDVILDAFLYGMGYAKVGYEVRTEESLSPVTDPLSGEPLSTDADEPLMEGESSGTGFKMVGGKPTPILNPDASTIPENKEIVSYKHLRRRDEPWAKRWEPWNILRDPEGKKHDLSDARFVAFRSVLPLEEVKGNPSYSNTLSLRGTEITRDALDRAENNFWSLSDQTDEVDERVELYEIWAREWNKDRSRWDMWVYVVAKGHDKFLMEKRSPYNAEGFPVKVLWFVTDTRTQWAPSILQAIDPQINTINQCLTYIAEFREKYVNKYLFNETVLQREDAQKIIKSKDEAVGVTIDEGTPVANVMDFLRLPNIPEWVFRDYELAWEIIMRVTGMSDYQLGGQGVSRQATEASYIQGAFNVRVNEKQDIVGDFVKGVARFWKQVLQQYGDYSMALKITNDVGEEEWTEFTIAETIPDDLNFDVEVYPAGHNSKEVEMERALSMYNLLRQDPIVNPMKLLEKVLRAFGETAPESFIQQQQPPVDPATGQPVPHGGAADAGAIDVNQMRQPTNTDGGNSGRAFGG